MKLDEDDILGDIMEELHSGNGSPNVIKPATPRAGLQKKFSLDRSQERIPDQEARYDIV